MSVQDVDDEISDHGRIRFGIHETNRVGMQVYADDHVVSGGTREYHLLELKAELNAIEPIVASEEVGTELGHLVNQLLNHPVVVEGNPVLDDDLGHVVLLRVGIGSAWRKQ